MTCGMRVIHPDGTVTEVPLEMETADAWVREAYIRARYVEARGSVTFRQTTPEVAVEEGEA